MSEIITPNEAGWQAAITSEYPEPGLYANVPASVYHRVWKHPSQSLMKPAIMQTPAHAKYDMDHPKEPSPAMVMGTALHALVLEPDSFDEVVQLGPGKTRNEGWRNLQAANPHIAYLKEDEITAVRVMANRVTRHPDVGALSRKSMNSLKEVSVVADLEGRYPAALDPEMTPFTLRCKCRLDWWVRKLAWNVDLKTTSDGGEDEFNRSIHQRGYHIQDAFYEAMMAASGHEVKQSVFVIVESEPPFEPDVRPLGLEALDRGRVLSNKMVALWAWCTAHNQYPGYPPGLVTSANLPRWALTTTDAISAWEELLRNE